MSDEFSSPEGENKRPKRKISSKPATPKRTYNSKYKTKTKVSRNSTSSRREVSPSTEPPALNGSKSGEKKGWIKKIFS